MARTNPSVVKRTRRKLHIRKRISGTADRPRLTVFRSLKHIYAQLIDDVAGVTLAAAGTTEKDFMERSAYGGNKKAAEIVGEMIGGRAIGLGVTSVVFDRNGYLYHGRVKALADAARKAGLNF